jgi:hypothetical protein
MPVLPVWAIALIVCGLLALLAYGSMILARKRLPHRWITILAVLRVAIVLVFALCLLQPIVSFRRTVEEGPPVFVMLDTSKSMAVKDSPEATARLADSVQWLQQSGLKGALANRPNVHWFGFDAHARTVQPADLASLDPAGSTTRYADSLTDAWDAYRQQRTDGTPVAPGGRVLLISDGNDLDARDAAEAARKLGLAVDTLAPAAAPAGQEAARITVSQVQAPRRVLLGAESRFSVNLRQQGLADKPLKVQLKEGDKLVATQAFTFSGKEKEKAVTVAFRPEEAGLKEYAIEFDGVPASPAAEEARRFSVQVVGARNEVLFIEDSWRWEFKFLRRIFEDDPTFTLTAFLSRGESAFVQLAEPDRRTQVNGFPQSRAELAGFDTIVLGNDEPRRWPRGFAYALRQLVEEDGKSLIVIAGPHLREMMEQPGLAELLPVELSQDSAKPINGPVAVRVTTEGLATPYFASASGPAFWSSLQPMDEIYPALRKKPAATALMEATQLNNPYGNLIVMAEQPVGRGRVLFVATDTLWKWQMHAANTEGPTPYQAFWQQALRTLAPIRQSTGNVNLNLEPDRSRYEPGQTVLLRAEIQSGGALPKARVQAQVTLPDGKQLPLDFAPSPNEPGIHTAKFEATMAGQHKVAATVIAEDKTAADTLIAFDVEESSGELAGQRVNEATLTRIARDTGGHVINRADPASWKALASMEKVAVTRAQTLDLWNGYALLILLSVLLGADWLLRLLRGFA